MRTGMAVGGAWLVRGGSSASYCNVLLVFSGHFPHTRRRACFSLKCACCRCFAARVLDVYDLLQLDVAAPAFCPTLTLEVQLTVAQRLSRVYSGTAGPAQAPHLPTTPEMTAASITGIK